MAKKKLFMRLAVGIIAGLIVTAIVSLATWGCTPSEFRVQVSPLTQGSTVMISEDSQQVRPNRDGILFLQIRGTTKEYNGSVQVDVQAVDVQEWFEQKDVQHSEGVFLVRLQIGSAEWPVRGGEQYSLRAKAGTDVALARITVEKL